MSQDLTFVPSPPSDLTRAQRRSPVFLVLVLLLGRFVAPATATRVWPAGSNYILRELNKTTPEIFPALDDSGSTMALMEFNSRVHESWEVLGAATRVNQGDSPTVLSILFLFSLAAAFFGGYTHASRNPTIVHATGFGEETLALRQFRKNIRKNNASLGWENSFTMIFTSLDFEERFLADYADLMCRRTVFLCVTGLCCVGFHLIFKGRLMFQPDVPASDSFCYIFSGVILVLLLGFMLSMTLGSRRRTMMAFGPLMYDIILAWAAVVAVVMHMFFLHSFGKNVGSRPFTFILGLFILNHYICVHTPLRFKYLLFLSGGLPFFFLLFMKIEVIVGSYQQRTVTSHSGAQFDLDVLVFVVMIISTVTNLFAKHLVERCKRVAWITAYHTYKNYHEVEEEYDTDRDSLLNRTKGALGKVVQALDTMAACPEAVPRQVLALVSAAKANAEFAEKNLKRGDKLFVVTAEQVMQGKEYEGKQGLVDFINASTTEQMEAFVASTGLEEDTRLRRTRRNCSSTWSLGGSLSPEGRSRTVSLVEVASCEELCRGMGEDFGFNALDLARKTGGFSLIYAGEEALVRSGLCQAVGIEGSRCRAWLLELWSRYQKTSYHNETHGAQVIALSSFLAQQSGWQDKASELHLASLFLACAGHDVGHFGRNNLFCTKLEHTAAMIWNDSSPLENMHSAICFNVMRGQSDIFDGFDCLKRHKMRRYIIRFILSTDIKVHHSSLVKLETRMSDTGFLTRTEEGEDTEGELEEDLIQMGEALIKAGDIGHGLMPWAAHKEWSYRVTVEFFAQGDEERSLGLAISPLCDRNVPMNFAGSQAFFIDIFSSAVVKVIHKFAASEEGQKEIQKMLDSGLQNIERWKLEPVPDPQHLNEDFLNQKFGAPALEFVFPYEFDKDQLLNIKPTTSEQNLRELSDQRVLPDEPRLPTIDESEHI